MSLTVVTTRDYDDAPSCFEKYELGTLWRINGGDLEIFVGKTLAALYPSGNWVSVYADDAMQLFKDGTKPDYGTMPTVDAPVVRRSATVDDPMGTVPVPPNQPVEDDSSPLTFGSSPMTFDDDSVPIEDQQIVPNDEVIAARAAMTPVTFRPRRYRAAPPPAKKAPTGPRMLPIKLRMRPFRGVRDVEPARNADPAAPRMMPVTMRSTIYRAARPPRPELEAPGPVEDPDDDVTSDSP